MCAPEQTGSFRPTQVTAAWRPLSPFSEIVSLLQSGRMIEGRLWSTRANSGHGSTTTGLRKPEPRISCRGHEEPGNDRLSGFLLLSVSRRLTTSFGPSFRQFFVTFSDRLQDSHPSRSQTACHLLRHDQNTAKWCVHHHGVPNCIEGSMSRHDVSRSSKESSTGPIAVTRDFCSPFLRPARWFGRLVQRIGAAVQGGTIVRQGTSRWCDSTERALNDDLMGLRRNSFTVD
jgi:hypothetical protein